MLYLTTIICSPFTPFAAVLIIATIFFYFCLLLNISIYNNFHVHRTKSHLPVAQFLSSLFANINDFVCLSICTITQRMNNVTHKFDRVKTPNADFEDWKQFNDGQQSKKCVRASISANANTYAAATKANLNKLSTETKESNLLLSVVFFFSFFSFFGM